jgi:hypothetical protein
MIVVGFVGTACTKVVRMHPFQQPAVDMKVAFSVTSKVMPRKSAQTPTII